MDNLTREKRSDLMSRVRSEDTGAELMIRKLLHANGYRYRLHKKDLPGKPDIVLARYKTVIFVNGCFWHNHIGCKRGSIPQSNTEFWKEKFARNKKRDKQNLLQVRRLGWYPIVIWECETKNPERLLERLNRELSKGCDLSQLYCKNK